MYGKCIVLEAHFTWFESVVKTDDGTVYAFIFPGMRGSQYVTAVVEYPK